MLVLLAGGCSDWSSTFGKCNFVHTVIYSRAIKSLIESTYALSSVLLIVRYLYHDLLGENNLLELKSDKME